MLLSPIHSYCSQWSIAVLASTIFLCKIAVPCCGRSSYRSEYSIFEVNAPHESCSLKPIYSDSSEIEAKTPTQFVNQIFLSFSPHPKTGENGRNISSQSQLTLSNHLLYLMFFSFKEWKHFVRFVRLLHDLCNPDNNIRMLRCDVARLANIA